MKEITATELNAWRERAVPHQLVDVRDPYEAELCSIGGDLIPMSEVIDRLDELRKDMPVVVHCRSGNRSVAVIHALSSCYGFNNLVNLAGGIMAFRNEVDHDLQCD